MPTFAPCVIRSQGPAGDPVVRLGLPLLDDYLEFLAGRCRPNTVLAAALRPEGVLHRRGQAAEAGPRGRRAGVHDRAAHRPHRSATAAGRTRSTVRRSGCRARTVRRRLSSVSGLFAFLQARGDVEREPGAAGAARPAGNGNVRARACRWSGRPRTLPRILTPVEVDALTGGFAHAPGPGDGRRDGAGRAAPLRGRSVCGWRICGSPSAGCSSPRARAAISA